MRKRCWVGIPIFLIFFFSCFSVQADSPVWQVSKDGRYLYLGGTVHFLTPEDYPLPAAFDKAYADTTSIVLETDPKKVQSLEFQQSVLEKALYPGQETIEQHLQPNTLKALTAFLEERGIPLALFSKMKPGILSMGLTTLELQRLNLIGTGVDEHFYQKAIEDRLEIVFLETPEEQLSFMINMGLGQEDDLIDYTLTDLKDLPKTFKALKSNWRKGDMDALYDLSLKTMATKFPEVYRSIVAQRNNAWMSTIESMLQTPDVEFVLVGAAHLAGPQGLLRQLKSRGCKVGNM